MIPIKAVAPLCIVLFLVSTCSTAFASEVEISKETWGQRCNSSDSYQVDARNNSDRRLDIKICIEQIDHKWTCYGASGTNPGEETHTSAFACHSTGKTHLFWRTTGSNERLGSPE